ncbi:MAG: beta-galactosidase trimerization domain-containing protein, partial [Phycisphaerales bacterium]
RPELKKYVDDVKIAVKTVSGLNLCTEAAFVLPVMPYSLADEGGYKSDWLDMGGWVQLLNDIGIVTDIYTPYEIMYGSWDLSKYKVIIMSDCPVLPEKVNSVLNEYVRNGGAIIVSGRTPAKNLRNQNLTNKLFADSHEKSFIADHFVTNLANEKTPCKDIINAVKKPDKISLGQGSVFWIGEKIGKAYWGQARRERIYGNTPPVYVKPHYTQTAIVLREYIRNNLNETLTKIIDDRMVSYDSKNGSISVVPFLKSSNNYNGAKLFIINNGRGRHRSLELKFTKNLANAPCQVWTDFDRRFNMTVDEKGKLEVPDFASVAFVSFCDIFPL